MYDSLSTEVNKQKSITLPHKSLHFTIFLVVAHIIRTILISMHNTQMNREVQLPSTFFHHIESTSCKNIPSNRMEKRMNKQSMCCSLFKQQQPTDQPKSNLLFWICWKWFWRTHTKYDDQFDLLKGTAEELYRKMKELGNIVFSQMFKLFAS